MIKMHTFTALAALFFLTLAMGLFADGKRYDARYKQHREPAFEKIYVLPCQLLSTPEGRFYVDPCGNRIKIRTLLSDCQGAYILVVKYQCPLCGRCFLEPTPDGDWDCPIFKREIRPGYWID